MIRYFLCTLFGNMAWSQKRYNGRFGFQKTWILYKSRYIDNDTALVSKGRRVLAWNGLTLLSMTNQMGGFHKSRDLCCQTISLELHFMTIAVTSNYSRCSMTTQQLCQGLCLRLDVCLSIVTVSVRIVDEKQKMTINCEKARDADTATPNCQWHERLNDGAAVKLQERRL